MFSNIKETIQWLKIVFEADPNVVECEECGWVGSIEEVLHGSHPFQNGCTIYGCPKCGAIERFK